MAAAARKKRTAAVPSPERALTEYRRKRDFSRTAEPSGAGARAAHPSADAPLAFVVQKHAASHLHFDFRLEVDGVMKSWAVPKGPSLDPSVRRLAMQVEDHPVSYNTFEGTIPQGQYGGGTVMLWDRGSYLPADGHIESLRRGLRTGRIDIVMLGERLRGGFTMVRSGGDVQKPQWLLFKRTDEYAAPGADLVASEMTSVVTGRTMEEIAGDAGSEVWQSNRGGARKARASRGAAGGGAKKRSTAKRSTPKRGPKKTASKRATERTSTRPTKRTAKQPSKRPTKRTAKATRSTRG